jgi:ribosomal protein L24E
MNHDWRLTNQMNYLFEKKLIEKPYTKYSESWDHEHCEFCAQRIDETTGKAYATEDSYHWICVNCFSDFQSMFHWTVEKGNE